MKIEAGKKFRCLEDDVTIIINYVTDNGFVNYNVLALNGAYNENEINRLDDVEEELFDGTWEELK